jgi:hypothetical protein
MVKQRKKSNKIKYSIKIQLLFYYYFKVFRFLSIRMNEGKFIGILKSSFKQT